ncbi:MAG TPA: hypothetical protein DF409_07095, partial [Bacteroidales bacterium]|nr:hypothetical protein [Bacteroidales bacterium]
MNVTSFNTIGAVSLKLHYNPAVLDFLSETNNSGFPELYVYNPVAGTVNIGGFSTLDNGETYMDNTTLVTLNFLYKGGSTDLAWIDNGSSCEYQGPLGEPTLNDSPQSTYYIDGLVSAALPPTASIT